MVVEYSFKRSLHEVSAREGFVMWILVENGDAEINHETCSLGLTSLDCTLLRCTLYVLPTVDNRR